MAKPAPLQHFAIASHLLGGESNGLGWSNLGDWRNTNDYVIACQQLAAQVGLAAGLSTTSRLLDLGCGQGASLAFWQSHFSVADITALELQAECVEQMKRYQPAAVQLIAQGRFDQLPLAAELEAAINRQPFDTVVCVDAAYHARSLLSFAQVAKHSLGGGGHVALSTLMLSSRWQQASFWQKQTHQRLLALAEIPMLSVLDQLQIEHTLSSMGFRNIKIEWLDEAVLEGFSHHASRISNTLKPSAKWTKSWLKIAMTARLCRYLHTQQLIHYVVISAQLA